MINKVNIAAASSQKPVSFQCRNQNLTFGAAQDKKEHQSATIKKGAILLTAALLLAVPVALSKAPVGKFKSLQALQDRFNQLLEKLNIKATLDKLMGHKPSSDAGLNVLR